MTSCRSYWMLDILHWNRWSTVQLPFGFESLFARRRVNTELISLLIMHRCWIGNYVTYEIPWWNCFRIFSSSQLRYKALSWYREIWFPRITLQLSTHMFILRSHIDLHTRNVAYLDLYTYSLCVSSSKVNQNRHSFCVISYTSLSHAASFLFREVFLFIPPETSVSDSRFWLWFSFSLSCNFSSLLLIHSRNSAKWANSWSPYSSFAGDENVCATHLWISCPLSKWIWLNLLTSDSLIPKRLMESGIHLTDWHNSDGSILTISCFQVGPPLRQFRVVLPCFDSLSGNEGKYFEQSILLCQNLYLDLLFSSISKHSAYMPTKLFQLVLVTLFIMNTLSRSVK